MGGRAQEKTDIRREREYGTKGIKRAVIHLSHAEMSTKVTSPQLGIQDLINPFIPVIATLINHCLTAKAQCNFLNAQCPNNSVFIQEQQWTCPPLKRVWVLWWEPKSRMQKKGKQNAKWKNRPIQVRENRTLDQWAGHMIEDNVNSVIDKYYVTKVYLITKL